MLTYLLVYWILTTVYGVYWLIKYPSITDDPNEFSMFDLLAYVFPAACFAWVFVPMMVLHSIKFKRR